MFFVKFFTAKKNVFFSSIRAAYAKRQAKYSYKANACCARQVKRTITNDNGPGGENAAAIVIDMRNL